MLIVRETVALKETKILVTSPCDFLLFVIATSITKNRKWHDGVTRIFVPLTHYRPAMPFGNRKKYFRGFFSSALSLPVFKKYQPSGILKCNNLGVSQS